MEIDIKITDDSGRVHHGVNNKKPHKSIQQNKNVKMTSYLFEILKICQLNFVN